MSDLDEIAAAAGIAILDDGEDAGSNTDHSEKSLKCDSSVTDSNTVSTLPQVLELEAAFANRYTDLDPDYVKAKEDTSPSNPPCVTDFFARRPREDNRNWQRNRNFDGERRDYRNHDNRGRNEGWNRGYRPYNRPGDYGDYNRDEKDNRRRGYRDRSPHR